MHVFRQTGHCLSQPGGPLVSDFLAAGCRAVGGKDLRQSRERLLPAGIALHYLEIITKRVPQ